jgi:hypothetical protein
LAQLIPSAVIINEQERVERAQRVRYVIATQCPEGLEMEPEEVISCRYVEGELSSAELIEEMNKLPL